MQLRDSIKFAIVIGWMSYSPIIFASEATNNPTASAEASEEAVDASNQSEEATSAAEATVEVKEEEEEKECPCDFSKLRSGGSVNERNFVDRWQVTYTERGPFTYPKGVAILSKDGKNHSCYIAERRGRPPSTSVEDLTEIADCQQKLRALARGN